SCSTVPFGQPVPFFPPLLIFLANRSWYFGSRALCELSRCCTRGTDLANPSLILKRFDLYYKAYIVPSGFCGGFGVSEAYGEKRKSRQISFL
ncbi:MAG: hypothetical protein VST68_04015, partial [Nitrospirota bacterium]|nr:hypothetical protein [Nitrospirota bacterium]